MTQLPELAQALLNPKTYPEATRQVELMQTQMSFVFLTDDYVYKVKKPVDLGYLDYSTLEKRRLPQDGMMNVMLAREQVSPEMLRRVAGIPPTEHRFEGFTAGIYSPEFSRLTYDTMFSEAKHVLGAGGSAIIDASFIRAEERSKAKKLSCMS